MPQFDSVRIPDQSKLRDYQKECIDRVEEVRPNGGSHLVVLPTGSGKCFAPGTEILMYDGSIRKIETIKEGEQVMGPDSKPRTVVGLAHGFEDMYEIIPKKGDPYVVNESHILSLKATGNKKAICDSLGNRYFSGDVCNISIKDYLKCSDTFKHCMKGYRVGIDFEEKPLELEPYIFGLWLADGTTTVSRITIANRDTELINYLIHFAIDNNLILSVVDQPVVNNSKQYVFTTKNHKKNESPINELLNKYNLRKGKYIPSHYLCNTRENRLKLLAGLLDGDGYYGGGCYEICTVREIMRNNILYLARSLGFAAYSSNKIVNGKIYYRITISGEINEIPVLLKRKQASKRLQKKSVLNTGISIKSLGEDEYYGFELIGPDRLFLLADFTVVHNTFVFSHIPRYGNTLILSHRDELVHQPEKYYVNEKVFDKDGNELPPCTFGVEQAGESSNGEEVVSASVQSLIRRYEKFAPDYFDTIIIDECFPANTLIDGKPISEYKVGDYVNSFNHKTNQIEKKKILHVFKKVKPQKMVVINKQLTCTLNHPIYCVNRKEYVNAEDIKPGDSLLYLVQRQDTMDKFNKKSKRFISLKSKGILLRRMQKSIFTQNKFGDYEQNQQKICFRENEKENSNRNRWGQSFSSKKKRTRYKENKIFTNIRVDSVEIIESNSNTASQFMSVYDNYVYNLEVEDNNNYFANNILVHNCHHAPAESYRRLIDYFKPNLLLGFTATPDRNDKADLHEIFDTIVYMKDMRWGIEQGYLTDIECFQVNCGYDLDDTKIVMGDFHQPTLAKKMMEDDVMDNTIRAYNELRKGQTLIFAVNVDHAYALQQRIPNSVVIEAKTPNRDKIFEDFTNRKIDCIINVFVITEGTDLPLIETVMMARPTKNLSLLTQCIGRGLRPYPGKEVCRLIDCVGVSKRKLATVGTLFGIDEGKMPEKDKSKLFGCRITEMEDTIEEALDTPVFWISDKKINMFKEDHDIDLRYINFVPLVNDSLVVSLPGFKVTILPEDALGNTKAVFENKFHQKSVSPEGSLQETIDRVHNLLTMKAVDERVLWDTRLIDRTWGIKSASEKQVKLIESLAKQSNTSLDDIDLNYINKRDAGILITKMKDKIEANKKVKKSYRAYNNPHDFKCKTKYS